MKYVKIVYKNEYDTPNKKGKRPLLRAYNKANVKSFIERNHPFILAMLNNNCLYELLTGQPILVNNYDLEEVDYDTVKYIIENAIKNDELEKVRDIISVMFFNEDIDLGFEISEMEEVALDRALQFDAYNDDLTDINPYDFNDLNNYTISKVKLYSLKK